MQGCVAWEVIERSELRCLVSCIYLFFNKYNWLCVFRWGVRQRKPGAEAGLSHFLVCFGFGLSLLPIINTLVKATNSAPRSPVAQP